MSDKILVFDEPGEEDILIELLGEELDDFGYRDGGAAEKVKKVKMAFEQALKPVQHVANQVLRNVREFAETPEEVTLTMGIKMNGEAKAVFTKVGGEANFQLTIKWTQDSIAKAAAKDRPA